MPFVNNSQTGALPSSSAQISQVYTVDTSTEEYVANTPHILTRGMPRVALVLTQNTNLAAATVEIQVGIDAVAGPGGTPPVVNWITYGSVLTPFNTPIPFEVNLPTKYLRTLVTAPGAGDVVVQVGVMAAQ